MPEPQREPVKHPVNPGQTEVPATDTQIPAKESPLNDNSNTFRRYLRPGEVEKLYRDLCRDLVYGTVTIPEFNKSLSATEMAKLASLRRILKKSAPEAFDELINPPGETEIYIGAMFTCAATYISYKVIQGLPSMLTEHSTTAWLILVGSSFAVGIYSAAFNSFRRIARDKRYGELLSKVKAYAWAATKHICKTPSISYNAEETADNDA